MYCVHPLVWYLKELPYTYYKKIQHGKFDWDVLLFGKIRLVQTKVKDWQYIYIYIYIYIYTTLHIWLSITTDVMYPSLYIVLESTNTEVVDKTNSRNLIDVNYNLVKVYSCKYFDNIGWLLM